MSLVLCEKNISKRSASTFEDNPVEPPAKRLRLTRQNLQIYEMQTSNPNTFMPSHGSQPPPLSTTKTSRTKSVSVSDSSFGDAALKNRIYDCTTSLKATNIEDWEEICNRSRDTASPDEVEFEDYRHNITTACSEAGIVQYSQSLFKEYKGLYKHGYRKTYNEALSRIPSAMGFNNNLSPAQPDFLEGYDLAKFRPYQPQDLNFAVVKHGMSATTLPHLAGEFKGQGKDLRQAAIQAAYDGAIMVCGRREALSKLGRSDPENCGNVATFTSDGATLNIYTHHSTGGSKPEYHQTLVETAMLIESYDAYKKGRKVIRNIQDFAKESASSLKDELISLANNLPADTNNVPATNMNHLMTENTTNCPTAGTNDLATEAANNLIANTTEVITHINDLSQPQMIHLHQLAKGSSRRHHKCGKAKPKYPPKPKQATKHRYSTRNNPSLNQLSM